MTALPSFDQVPTIDLRRFDTDRSAFVNEVGAAYRQFGFCCFSNHGIPEQLISSAYEDFKSFFALPDTVKRSYQIPGRHGARGFTPYKIETAKDQSIADLKEFWHIGREEDPATNPYPELLHPNIWPSQVPTFRNTGLALYQAMEAVGLRILSSMAIHIGLAPNYFDRHVQHGDSILRALHYPPVHSDDLPAVRAGAHEDIDLITLLVGATGSGLELLTAEGEWLQVPARQNTLVVNVGDMLQRLTNHTYRSTTHRVVNPQGAAAQSSRYSMPFFLHLDPAFEFKTLPQCITDQNPDRYENNPMTAQQFLDQRLREIKLA